MKHKQHYNQFQIAQNLGGLRLNKIFYEIYEFFKN